MNAIRKRSNAGGGNSKKTNAVRYKPEDEQDIVEHLRPSNSLSERQHDIFNNIVRSFPPTFFTEADRYVLESYCRLVEAHEAAAGRFEKQGGMNPKSTMAGMRKGVLDVFLRTALGIATMSQRLRANPSSRMPVHVAKARSEDESEDKGGHELVRELHKMMSEEE